MAVTYGIGQRSGPPRSESCNPLSASHGRDTCGAGEHVSRDQPTPEDHRYLGRARYRPPSADCCQQRAHVTRLLRRVRAVRGCGDVGQDLRCRWWRRSGNRMATCWRSASRCGAFAGQGAHDRDGPRGRGHRAAAASEHDAVLPFAHHVRLQPTQHDGAAGVAESVSGSVNGVTDSVVALARRASPRRPSTPHSGRGRHAGRYPLQHALTHNAKPIRSYLISDDIRRRKSPDHRAGRSPPLPEV